MTNIEVNKTLQRLAGAFKAGNPMEGENGTYARKEYTELLTGLNYSTLNQSITKMTKELDFYPKIKELLAYYSQINGGNKVVNKTFCNLCEDIGCLIVKEGEYNYTHHCLCDVGMSKSYEGNQCADTGNRTNYYVRSILSAMNVIEINEIEEYNRNRDKLIIPMPAEFKRQYKTFAG